MSLDLMPDENNAVGMTAARSPIHANPVVQSAMDETELQLLTQFKNKCQ